MILNYVWVGFILIAFVVALIKLIFLATYKFSDVVNGTFNSAKLGFEVSLGLTGALTLWMGLMKVGEKAGAINFLGKSLGHFSSVYFLKFQKVIPHWEISC